MTLRLLMAAALTAVAMSILAAPAAAQTSSPTSSPTSSRTSEPGVAIVTKISGLLDPVMADFMESSLDEADDTGAVLLVLQVNSKGAVISDSRLESLADRIASSPVPVAAWVGPTGARATGKVAQLLAYTRAIGMAPGTRLGKAGADIDMQVPPGETVGGSLAWYPPDATDSAGSLASNEAGNTASNATDPVSASASDTASSAGDSASNAASTSASAAGSSATGIYIWGRHAELLADSTVSYEEALDLGIASTPAPTVGDFLVNLDDLGFQSAETADDDGQPQLEPLTRVRFTRLGAFDQLLHTVASPPIAYALLLVALWLFAFEFFLAGVGIAGATGALSLLLASYGLAVLPASALGIALLMFSAFAYCVDVQAGAPRFWTLIGTGALVWGTIVLFSGDNGAGMSWIPMMLGTAGMLAGMVWVTPVGVRSRFSTPTIGREWMIGEEGEAVEAINPDGVLKIGGTLWRAHSRRAAPIAIGEKAKIEELVGLTLMVEPIDDAADDGSDDGSAEEDDPEDDSAPETADAETPSIPR